MFSYVQYFALRYFVHLVFAAFLFLSLMGILRHEMWSDEMQPWLLASNSGSLSDFYVNFQHEGNPPLWYLCLFIVGKFSRNPIAMQILHVILASINAWLILRYAPFSRLQRFLLIFGYFLFYEYCLISRNYALGILFVFLFCILVKQSSRNYLLFSLILILLSLTGYMAWILSISLATYLVVVFFEKKDYGQKIQALCAIALLILGLLISLGFMLPSNVSKLQPQGTGRFFEQVHNIYFPDRFQLSFFTFDRSISLISIFILFFSAFIFLRERSVFIFYLIYLAFSVISFSFFGHCYTRHVGHLFLLLIICFWLSCHVSKFSKLFLAILLVVQFSLGIRAYTFDYLYNFSASKDAYEYIRSLQIEGLPTVYHEFHILSLAGYLSSSLFFTKRLEFGKDVMLDYWRYPQEEAIVHAKRLSNKFNSDVLVVFTSPFRLATLFPSMKKLAEFKSSLGEKELFYVYLYEKNV